MQQADYSKIKSFLKRIREEGMAKEARDAATIGLLLSAAMESIARQSVCTCLNGLCPWHIANELVQTVEQSVQETTIPATRKFAEYDDAN